MAGRLAGLVGPVGATIALTFGASAFGSATARAPQDPAARGAGPLRGPDTPATRAVAAAGPRLTANGGVSAAQLRAGLAAQMRATGGASGAFVVDLDAASGGQLFSWASKTRRILASNMKLFTTAALLERYGSEKT